MPMEQVRTNKIQAVVLDFAGAIAGYVAEAWLVGWYVSSVIQGHGI